MPRIHWKLPSLCSRLQYFYKDKWKLIRITFLSFCYNSFTTRRTICDLALEPLFWFVDKFGAAFGPIFVAIVIIGTSFVVGTFYVFILPWIYETSFWLSAFHTVFGHWLLLNIVFHYYMGLVTDPGKPPQGHLIKHAVTMCKRCIAPKPARTHHCSVCNVCILKMDHHCPWLNSCVGHYNHRYFFLFCVYMWVGTIYVCISVWPLFKEHFWTDLISFVTNPHDSILGPGIFMPLPFWGFINFMHLEAFKPMNYSKLLGKPYDDLLSNQSGGDAPVTPASGPLAGAVPGEGIFSDFRSTHRVTHFCVMLEFTLCFGVAIALGALTAYHFRLISRGETSIEAHINSRETDRLKKFGTKYKNPYHFGFKGNWRLFLGLNDERTFLRHVLFPSPHKPEGAGLLWRTTTYTLPDAEDGGKYEPLESEARALSKHQDECAAQLV